MLKRTLKPKAETKKRRSDYLCDCGRIPWHWIAFGLCAIFALFLIFANTRAAPPLAGDLASEADEYAGIQVIGMPVRIVRDKNGELRAAPIELPIIRFTDKDAGRQ